MYCTVKLKMNVFMQEYYAYIHICMGVLVVLCVYVGELHGLDTCPSSESFALCVVGHPDV